MSKLWNENDEKLLSVNSTLFPLPHSSPGRLRILKMRKFAKPINSLKLTSKALGLHDAIQKFHELFGARALVQVLFGGRFLACDCLAECVPTRAGHQVGHTMALEVDRTVGFGWACVIANSKFVWFLNVRKPGV